MPAAASAAIARVAAVKKQQMKRYHIDQFVTQRAAAPAGALLVALPAAAAFSALVSRFRFPPFLSPTPASLLPLQSIASREESCGRKAATLAAAEAHRGLGGAFMAEAGCVAELAAPAPMELMASINPRTPVATCQQ